MKLVQQFAFIRQKPLKRLRHRALLHRAKAPVLMRGLWRARELCGIPGIGKPSRPVTTATLLGVPPLGGPVCEPPFVGFSNAPPPKGRTPNQADTPSVSFGRRS